MENKIRISQSNSDISVTSFPRHLSRISRASYASHKRPIRGINQLSDVPPSLMGTSWFWRDGSDLSSGGSGWSSTHEKGEQEEENIDIEFNFMWFICYHDQVTGKVCDKPKGGMKKHKCEDLLQVIKNLSLSKYKGTKLCLLHYHKMQESIIISII